MYGVLSRNDVGTLVGGVSVNFGSISADVASSAGTGSINAQGNA
jgi:hypothetical protein